MNDKHEKCPSRDGRYCKYTNDVCNPRSVRCKLNQKQYSILAPSSCESKPYSISNKKSLPDTTGLRIINFSNSIPQVIVYNGYLTLKKGTYEECVIIVKSLDGSRLYKMLVAYCNPSKKIYIANNLLNDYLVNNYRARVHYVLATHNECSEPLIYDDKKEISILGMYGYRVGKTNGLSDAEREEILTFILERHYMSALDIINLLNYNIMLRKKRKSIDYSAAINDWKHDISYVRKCVAE